MEAAFGADFGSVRVHHGAEADGLNRSLQAHAFTTGPDIFFAKGNYAPATRSGEALLAHELAHVVQQGATPPVRRRSTGAPYGTEVSSPPPRRSAGFVQRAILAVDGAGDDADARNATKNCLSNLTSHKQIRTDAGKTVKHYPAGDARGSVFGPAGASSAFAGLAGGSASVGPLETIYVLGHGSTKNVAGLDPTALAAGLAGSFAAYPETFIGGVKIVACYRRRRWRTASRRRGLTPTAPGRHSR